MILGLAGFKSDYDQPSDGELADVIKRRLRMQEGAVADRIQVKVRGGHVTLSGVVDTVVEKGLAEGLVANTIVGVRSVHNNIAVRPAVFKDDAIKKAVEANLETALALEGKSIAVDVRDGMVELQGMVDSIRQRHAAEEAAKLVKGVRGVINLVDVSPSRPDRDIERDVAFYLLWSPLVDIDKIDSKVKNGVVTLTGSVEHMGDLVSMVEDIERVAGVVNVDFSGVRIEDGKRKAAEG